MDAAGLEAVDDFEKLCERASQAVEPGDVQGSIKICGVKRPDRPPSERGAVRSRSTFGRSAVDVGYVDPTDFDASYLRAGARTVVGGVKPRINGEQRVSGTTRCSACVKGLRRVKPLRGSFAALRPSR